VDEATLPRAHRRGPACVEPIGRGHGKKPNVAAVFRHEPGCLDRLWRDRAHIGDYHLAIRSRLTQPVGPSTMA
jgi:hypothetical protein